MPREKRCPFVNKQRAPSSEARSRLPIAAWTQRSNGASAARRNGSEGYYWGWARWAGLRRRAPPTDRTPKGETAAGVGGYEGRPELPRAGASSTQGGGGS